MTWVLDCDGVVWLADQVIPGAASAVSRLRKQGQRVVFLTNNSFPRRDEHLAKLERMGMATDRDDLISSAMAAARLVNTGERVLVLGGPGITEELLRQGVDVWEPGHESPSTGSGTFDAVVVGFDPQFDFARLAAATTALRAGARLVATNDDATFPAPGGVLPGAGSFVAAVAKAGGVVAAVAGKPHRAVAELLGEKVEDIKIVVGDRPSTDGRLAERLGTPFGLVLTGVTPPGHSKLHPQPAFEAADLASLVDQLLDGGAAGSLAPF
ncbi:MAG: HAD-IIA family hydrolase [Acidimicrobiales bacterium]